MVQERNLEQPKFQEQDIDQRPRRARVGQGDGGGSNVMADTATGLALLLSIVSFFFSSIAVVQAVRTHRDVEAMLQANRPAATSATSVGQTNRQSVVPRSSQAIAQRVEPGRFIQPIYNGDGRIELLSVDRVNGASDSNVVNLKMRVQRVREQVTGVGDINLAKTVAINSRTNMRYSAFDFRTPFGNALSLYSLRPGESADVMVMLRVPEGLNRVDLQIPETVLFRGVPIATSSSTTAR
ncbi:MAG: hypothetical protein LH660_14530 [Phormidesmis sp. CAN_BIN36]|nr:hypothetical protein [Phormidesmis sp. CAN_BIN36]